MTIKVGDRLARGPLSPPTTADGPKPLSTEDAFKGKTVALAARAGRHSPTCSATLGTCRASPTRRRT